MSKARDIADAGNKVNFLDNVTEDLNTALGAVEGTELKSTGESGGSKFLREDGDNSCSWQGLPANEGTAVLSTGESGGSKFLREDGDNSCSWQTVIAVPTGSIFQMAFTPNGSWLTANEFLICDGTAVSRSTYANLFAVLSTTWGNGDGSNTFNIPDLRGAYLRGIGTAGVSSDYAGPSLGAYQDDQNATHNHSATSNSSSNTSVSVGNVGDHRHSMHNDGNSNSYFGVGGDHRGSGSAYAKQTYPAGGHGHNANASTSTSTSTSIGNQGGTEVRVYNRGVQYIIKF